MKPYCFIHVPKTAGTSFRLAIENACGSERVMCDYGLQSSKTHPGVQTCVYKNGDIFSLKEEIAKHNIRFIAGHIPANKYLAIVPASQIITFIRNPVDQIISHYQHHKRHNSSFKKTFREYLKTSEANNFQSRLLSGVPLECIGLLGVTERFSESIGIFNRFLGLDIAEMHTNANPDKDWIKNNLNSKIVKTIIDANKKDLQLLRRANEILTIRKNIEDAGALYVHGKIVTLGSRFIRGFAYFSRSDEPVFLQCLINGELYRDRIPATMYRPTLLPLHPPRNGCVGFDIDVKPGLSEGDRIECRVVGTNQALSSRVFKNRRINIDED